MKDSDQLLSQTRASLTNTPTEAGQTVYRQDPEAIIDAINQVFAEFELVYHNQYHKAFPDLEKLQYAKKLWYSNLNQYSAEQILSAAHQTIRNSEYLPTIHSIIKHCENDYSRYGLPEPREAYVEACKAASPKAAQPWSHPAVYLAGKASDWFFLANNIETKALPVFTRHYEKICQRVRQGEQLHIDPPEALPESIPSSLSSEEQLEKIQAIKEALKK